ncbi:formate dehydrogenase subunit gamma [Marinobacter sp. 2_MG-2023]|uniref:formate dehydrogenase subunit gamma n=1 Tax=Marinobacter sp. 2_MG-2023 TaxID=3062679 RepID=UPI0026E46E13|nr:formate dehydrogenase subunit gamma [Marinobacter sp. 2_MG-2023]MDO6441899.1 formate dehydrogenase subunit gamma [Marinobacter sp. 2_MG-2023]
MSERTGHKTVPLADDWNPDMVRQDVAALQHEPGAVLPILHAIQNRIGYVPDGAVPIIAEMLQQTRADIHGVISFYHHFRTRPAGSNILEVCRAEACQARGGRTLEHHVQEKLGVGYHQTTADNEFTLEPVYCLGNCACGPSIRLNDEIIGRVTPQSFDELADKLTTSVLKLK